MPVYNFNGKSFDTSRFFVIAGPCVIERPESTLEIATRLAELSARLDLPLIFKASFDKANRTSIHSYRGPGLKAGLEVLAMVGEATGLPLLSDIHLPEQAGPAAQILDVLQIPAFLCRQTDLLVAAAATGKVVNVKKGQFMAPADMRPLVNKIKSAGNSDIWLTERGNSFGYNNLVVDMRGLSIMGETGCPVIFDATHSVQLPGGQGECSGGDSRFIAPLAAAAVAAGAHGVFFETHPNPSEALCDGANSLPLSQLEGVLRKLMNIYKAVRCE